MKKQFILIIFTLCAAAAFGQAEFKIIETSAAFPGGMAKFMKYFSKNFNQKLLKNKDLRGAVYVEFIITEKGTVDPDSIRTLSANDLSGMSPMTIEAVITDKAICEETKRVFRKSPPWSPGLREGVPQWQRFTLPVKFQ